MREEGEEGNREIRRYKLKDQQREREVVVALASVGRLWWRRRWPAYLRMDAGSRVLVVAEVLQCCGGSGGGADVQEEACGKGRQERRPSAGRLAGWLARREAGQSDVTMPAHHEAACACRTLSTTSTTPPPPRPRRPVLNAACSPLPTCCPSNTPSSTPPITRRRLPGSTILRQISSSSPDGTLLASPDLGPSTTFAVLAGPSITPAHLFRHARPVDAPPRRSSMLRSSWHRSTVINGRLSTFDRSTAAHHLNHQPPTTSHPPSYSSAPATAASLPLPSCHRRHADCVQLHSFLFTSHLFACFGDSLLVLLPRVLPTATASSGESPTSSSSSSSSSYTFSFISLPPSSLSV
ncbi:hypothetical protein E2C01_014726 [Portunus trituberculatus]|uniref:Uncharacterized protein n=1 Tax=Portunus trituberculatus TaxID=210409 RepID=A0A5B7DJZ4_PORTR|nr:hypothetical protein [Portunus trituberculatus]